MVDQVRVDRVEMVQSRAQLDMIVIQEYAEALGEGVVFPPISVVREGDKFWCWDGNHRVLAARQAGVVMLPAEVENGTRRDAVLASVGANARHGLRRSDADKRRSVRMLLEDPEWGVWSDREIARLCAVSHPFVAKMRAEVLDDVSAERRYVTGAGTEAVMDTSRIGRGGGLGLIANEAELVSAIVEDLRGRGYVPRQEVHCGIGFVDILNEDQVIEVKYRMDRESLYKAIGQVLLYREAVDASFGAKVVCTLAEPEALGVEIGLVERLGVEVEVWGS